MIKISDTGSGMSLDKINDILNDSRELSKEELSQLNELDISLSVALKIIKLLGGNMNIRSDKSKGTEFSIFVDQRCVSEEEDKLLKSAETYASLLSSKKKVLIVDDNKEELFKLKNIFGNNNYDVNITINATDCINKINTGVIYNLIVIDDELKGDDALPILKKLRENKKFKTPVVVMLNKNKENLKEDYIEEGFKDIVLKENIIDEIKRIINKY